MKAGTAACIPCADERPGLCAIDFAGTVRLDPCDARKGFVISRMRAPLFFFSVFFFASSGLAAAQVASVMPASCTKREALDAAEYQRLGRFLALGRGYRQLAEKDCYPSRLDEAALAQTDRPIGHVAAIGEHDVFIADLGPDWFSRCTKTATPDLREIGFAEARMPDKTALFAVYLATADRVADVECFENLDDAITRAAEELRRPAAR